MIINNMLNDFNIIAVVVTFNRRKLLQETLNAIFKQTIKPKTIIIIDNNSTDGTKEFVNSLSNVTKIFYERLENNIGGAGGFKKGLKKAFKLGADWVWCMDDDCEPQNDCLEKLINAVNIEFKNITPGFLASRVLWTDGTPCLMNLPVAHQMWIEPHGRYPFVSRVLGSSFVSMLVSRKAIETVGLPVEEFFIWFDDAEYSRRISSILPSYLVTDSVVVHKVPKNFKPLEFKELNKGNLWKYRYGIRNECSYFFHKRGIGSAMYFIAGLVKRMAEENLKIRFWPSLINAVIAGFLFNYQRYIEFPNK